MKQDIYNLITTSGNLTIEDVFLNIIFATIYSLFIYISYYITHKGTIYSKKFNSTLVILCILTSSVMTVIGNNIALSLGMVGALSIVRFRTAIKDSRDTAYIFWSIIVGICTGVSDYLVAGIGSAMVLFVTIILGCIKNDGRMLIIIKGHVENDYNLSSHIKSTIYNYFDGKALLKVENTTTSSIELIYEVNVKLVIKKEKIEPLTQKLYELKNIDYVNMVIQNDEISS